jgi:hypothetical protein
MSYCSAFDSTFLSTVEQWIDAKGEVLAMIRFAYSAGAKSFEFYDSFSAFNIRLRQLPPSTCVIVFHDFQLQLRGCFCDEFLLKARAMMQEGHEFLLVGLEKVTIGVASWYENVVVQTLAELDEEFRERCQLGKKYAFGPYPPWLEDCDTVISAVVPDEHGVVKSGAY